MILFLADSHYGTHAGRALYECIKDDYEIEFVENECRCLESGGLHDRYQLLILNMIAGCCNLSMPSHDAESAVRSFVEKGGNLLLLHGGSAAFWECDWWRRIVGFRWVRGEDEDGFPPSTHPVRPYTVKVAKSRHPLCRKLRNMDLPEDEIYINLEQTVPTTTLMETVTDEGTFPMCYETITQWGGRILGYLPGHNPDVIRRRDNVANCRVLIDELLQQDTAVDLLPKMNTTSALW